MNACHVIFVVAISAIMILGANADRKYCSCDLRWSTRELRSGQSANGLSVLENLPDPSYHHWLVVGCQAVHRNCPDDCLDEAHDWMGGSGFTNTAGRMACESVRRNAPPGSPIYVYATYDPSVCGDRTWQYVAPLCCWEIAFRGYDTIFLYNHRCAESSPPRLIQSS
ncbi:uncharacterized protein LOC119730776 [Patiria miniata]|uniref:Uncharacterized protein n=1 Tax=Patiria miniata TaxID=46514 RepID=A0A914A790_PATMI|nr:uncharacterized protein LOC119730776 [Patiria miniata]